LRGNAAKLPEKKARIKTLNEERGGLTKQLPKAASPEEARIQKEMQDKRAVLTIAQQGTAVDKQKLQTISDIRLDYARRRENRRRQKPLFNLPRPFPVSSAQTEQVCPSS
jgi:hypothetical protein